MICLNLVTTPLLQPTIAEAPSVETPAKLSKAKPIDYQTYQLGVIGLCISKGQLSNTKELGNCLDLTTYTGQIPNIDNTVLMDRNVSTLIVYLKIL